MAGSRPRHEPGGPDERLPTKEDDMAEIETARRPTVHWSWVLCLIVVALAAWLAADAVVEGSPPDAGGGRSTQGAASEEAPAEPPPLPWPVAALEPSGSLASHAAA
jgi:hypothetical protein